MTWTAPNVERPDPLLVADERAMLESWLDHHRATLLTKCAGLSGEQLKERSIAPSSLSLLGLVRHLADVERSWFQRRVAGADAPALYWAEDNEDGEFDDVDGADAEADYRCYLREVDSSRSAAAGRSLNETFFHSNREVDLSVRWVFVHMIEEYARHNGHADLLRERIDGVTGE